MQEPLGKVEQEQKDAGPTTGHRRMPEPVDSQVSLRLALSLQRLGAFLVTLLETLATLHVARQCPAIILPQMWHAYQLPSNLFLANISELPGAVGVFDSRTSLLESTVMHLD